MFLCDSPNARDYAIQRLVYLVMFQDTKLKSLERQISTGLGKTSVAVKYTVLQNSIHAGSISRSWGTLCQTAALKSPCSRKRVRSL